jgi:N6-adenosine-specific RNA methylase IME4
MSAAEIITRQGEVIPFTRSNLAKAEMDAAGLRIPEGLSMEEWASMGDALARAAQSVMWWIGDWWAYGDKQGYGERSQVLEKLRAKGHNPPSFKTCARAGTISRAFISARRRALLTFDHHKAVASLEQPEQDWMLDRAEANGWSRAELQDEVRRYKLERIRRPGAQKYETQTVDDLQVIIERGQKFGTIYADPPWPYGNQATRAATSDHYKEHNTLSIEDICNLPVPALAADAAHCHLWTTNGFLREAFDVMAAWGFTYKSCFVWTKPDFGLGNYWRVGHEFMLFGLKGKAPFGSNNETSWMHLPAGEHSAKPYRVRQAIERCSPGPRLELFGRKEVENWTVWGNEIERRSESIPLFGDAK